MVKAADDRDVPSGPDKNSVSPEGGTNLNQRGNEEESPLSNTGSGDQQEVGGASKQAKPTNQVTESDLESPNQNAPYGGSLSLARIQSLVSMTTPRDAVQPGIHGSPSFVEFDQSIDGFGCLFLPSVFPQFQSESERPSRVANLYVSCLCLVDFACVYTGTILRPTATCM